MGILLAFAPFIVFAIIDRVAGPTEGLVAAALVSAALLVRDWITPGRSTKILEIGTLLMFGGLALYASSSEPRGYAPDFLERPVDKRRGGEVFFGVPGTTLAVWRMRAIMVNASMTSETCRCQPCQDLVSL